MTDWNADKLDDLMDRYVFGLLERPTADRTRRKIETDPEWQLAYEAAVARKRALTQAVAQGAVEAAATRGPYVDEVIAAARQRETRGLRRRNTVRNVFGAMAAAAAIVIAVMWVRVATVTRPEMYVRLVGQLELQAGSTASLRAIVADMNGVPLKGKSVELVLCSDDEACPPQTLARWTSDAAGAVAGCVDIPDWPEGTYRLIARPDGNEDLQLSTEITIKRAHKVYLATDKPIYKPGQTIHMRTLILRKPALKPLAGGQAEFTVTDPAGNVIFAQPVTLSDYGIASADLPLDELVRPGMYDIKVRADGDESTQTVEIFHYRLPAFAVKIATDKTYYLPGQTVTGHVQVDYHFGKPVAGGIVKLKLASGPLAGFAKDVELEQTATTDATGRAAFTFALPATLLGSQATSGAAHLQLTARAVDTAGQENTAARIVPVAPQDIRIAVVPENGRRAPGLEGRIYIVTSYADGRPARTTVDIETLARSVRTDDTGAAVISVRNIPDRLRLSARGAAGLTGRDTAYLPAADEALILRTDKALYTAGQTVAVEVLAAEDGEIYLDVVKDRQTVLTKTVALADGRGTLALDLPPDLAGTLQLHAYRLNTDAEWVGRDMLIVVRPAAGLNVTVTPDRATPYRPGQDATLKFRVTRAGPAGAAGVAIPAAISLAAVDSAVYSVHRAAPGLAATLAGLDAELLRPAVEAHGFDPALAGKHDLYAQAILAAFAAPDLLHGKQAVELPERTAFVLQSVLEREQALGLPESVALRAAVDGSNSSTHTLREHGRERLNQAYGHQKWARRDAAETWTWWGAALAALCLVVSFTFSGTGRKLKSFLNEHSTGCWCLGTLLLMLICAALVLAMVIPQFTEASSDARMTALASDRQTLLSMIELAKIQQDGTTGGGAGNPSLSPAVRVRSYFPETMLWRPEIITDANGVATLTIPLADSITTWKLTGSAVSGEGELGAVDSSIRVFQPFFVDVDAPVALISGDEASLPIVVYNYTKGELTVSLQADGSAALEIVSGAKADVQMAAGQVKRVFVRVRAGAPGPARLTVRASAQGVGDAIVREIAIDPPGLPRQIAVNGAVTGGEQVIDVEIPADAAPGSVSVRLKVYPSTFSELLDGMEGIFRMPHGCFEQTSSTTYPNVMALAYMKAQGIGSPEVRATATRYIHLGYQRLLSFEVDGRGGFSLFGRAPANLALTAYGLMEFTDMARVHRVDKALLERTARWIERRQDGNGSWSGHLPTAHGPSRNTLAATAYVTWALAGSDFGRSAASRGSDYIARHVAEARDAHTLALCANALFAANVNRSAALQACERLAAMVGSPKAGQQYWSADGAQLAYGRGASGDIETTALAALALHRAKTHPHLVTGALRYLAANRDGRGTWGTTQATVMALKALLAASNTPTKRDRPATFAVEELTDAAGGRRPLGRLTIRPAQSEAVHTLKLDGLTAPGTHRVRLTTAGAVGMGYQVVVHYYAPPVPPAPEAPLAVTVSYDTSRLGAMQTVRVKATVANRADVDAKVLLVDLGTPPGFTVDPAALDRLRDTGAIDRYTLTARGVILYVPVIAARSALNVEYDMRARYPVRAAAAPTRVYPYYQPEQSAAAQPPRIDTGQ